MDSREDRVHDLLDEWRLDALVADSASAERLQDLFILLVDGFSCDLAFFSEVVQSRLESQPTSVVSRSLSNPSIDLLVNTPHMQREKSLLTEMLDIGRDSIQDGDMDKWKCLTGTIEYASDEIEKVVVFASYPSVAQRLAKGLQKKFGAEAVASLYDGMDKTPNLEIRRFQEEASCLILVADQAGEEGCNLQFADMVVHYDLPLSPNRIEQRLGRLDRIGRSKELVIRALIGPEFFEGDKAYFQQWYDLLKNGFEIFSRSIASLQFYVDRVMPDLKSEFFKSGVHGLKDAGKRIDGGIEEEMKEIRNQDALDAVTVGTLERSGYIEELRDFDADFQVMQSKMDPWISKVLQFDRRFDGALHYEPVKRTIVPTDALLNRFLPHLRIPVTYKREVAISESGVEILRLGNGFITSVADYIEWDDRGRAFAFWRHHHSWPSEPGSEWVGFRFDFVVEADIKPAIRCWQDTEVDKRAVRRRGDSLFPPFSQTLFVTATGEIESREPVLDILNRPFRRMRDGGTDRNLHRDRASVIDDFVERGQWSDACSRVRSIAEKELRSSDEFRRRVEAGSKDAASFVERQKERLRLRPEHERAELEKYKRLSEAISSGIGDPHVRLDAIGFIIVSGQMPPDKAMDN